MDAIAESTSLVVNGVRRTVASHPDRPLLFVLRDDLDLIGAKPGCGEGACGACTVLLADMPTHACRLALSEVADRPIRTIEGLSDGSPLHPVQQAWLEVGAFQCGYCTAGMIMATVALLERDPCPDDPAVTASLRGNACRCCTYPRIRRAVARAAELWQATGLDATPPTDMPAAAPAARTDLRDDRWSDVIRPRRPWDLTSPGDRDWFEVLPAGLVVVDESPLSDPAWSTVAGAWLHVGADGMVTAFTGKVDVGQDNRTALSMIVAGELGIPLASVRLVMGDTDLCPYDEGTFGSRSMPDAVPPLRRVAARARSRLVRLAAYRTGDDLQTLYVSAGGVMRGDGESAATFPDLLRDRREVESVEIDGIDLEPNDSTTPLVGRPISAVSGPSIVGGTGRYATDLTLPTVLHGRVLRPPTTGATLRSVATDSAAEIPGVMVVKEGDFVGIVADQPVAAATALGRLVADWDVPVLPSDVGIVDWLRTHAIESEPGWSRRGHPTENSDWGSHFVRTSGDFESAVERSPTYCSATYTTAYLAHVPLETRAALATWTAEGRVTIWTGTQAPFGVREATAAALDIEESDVRIIVPDTGGGFGGKHAASVAIEAAKLSRAAGRPVKVRWTRSEEFTGGHLRSAAVIDVRSGSDGRSITAWGMRNTNAGVAGLVGPYRVPNERYEYQPVEAPLRQGSYRGVAATANNFARESHIDELAHALGVDPYRFRLHELDDDRLKAVLREAAERIGWTDPRGPGEGFGIACGREKGARVATAVAVQVDRDRRLTIRMVVTALDCGAIVNPDGLTNQVEGAVIMGLGGAMFEAIRFRDGELTNASFTDYRVPRIDDVPPIEVILLDRPDQPSAGAGETPIIAIAPALANAIFDASGVRLRSLPLVPDEIVER